MNSPNACYGMMMQNGYATGDPGAFKVILSRVPLKEEEELIERLQISKDDLSGTRRTNIFGYQTGIIRK